MSWFFLKLRHVKEEDKWNIKRRTNHSNNIMVQKKTKTNSQCIYILYFCFVAFLLATSRQLLLFFSLSLILCHYLTQACSTALVSRPAPPANDRKYAINRRGVDRIHQGGAGVKGSHYYDFKVRCNIFFLVWILEILNFSSFVEFLNIRLSALAYCKTFIP